MARFLLMLLFLVATVNAGAELTSTQRRERVLRVYGLSPPYRITSWLTYEDGGSHSGYVHGSKGHALAFSIASGVINAVRVHQPEQILARLDSIKAIPTPLYIGHYQVQRSKAEQLEVGSDGEKALLDAIEMAARDQLGAPTVHGLDSLWVATGSRAAPDSALRLLGEDAAMHYWAYRCVIGLREHRRRYVAGWDD